MSNLHSRQYNMEPLQIYYHKNNIASNIQNRNYYSSKSNVSVFLLNIPNKIVHSMLLKLI